MRCKWSIRTGFYSCGMILLLSLAFLVSQSLIAPTFAQTARVTPEKAAERPRPLPPRPPPLCLTSPSHTPGSR